MTTQTALDSERMATDAAIQRAGDHAGEAWKAAAAGYVRRLAAEGREFTSQDALALLERERPDLTTHELRAMGSVMRALQSDGVIEPTGGFVTSERAGCHKQPKRLWRGV